MKGQLMTDRVERIAIRDRQRRLLTTIERASARGMAETVEEARRVRDEIVLAAEQLPGLVEAYQPHRLQAEPE